MKPALEIAEVQKSKIVTGLIKHIEWLEAEVKHPCSCWLRRAQTNSDLTIAKNALNVFLGAH